MDQQKRGILSLFDITMIVVGLVIGLGIFRTAADTALAAITPTVFFAAWLTGGLIALFGALTYAEIGSRLPVTGAYYRIFAIAYHPSLAFAINCIILLSNAASLAAVALIGSEYLTEAVFRESPSELVRSLIAMAAIVLFYVVNLLGLRLSAKAQNMLMIVKIGMLLVLIMAIFLPAQTALPSVVQPAAATAYSMADYITSFGGALVAVCFTYGGYQQTINFGGDVQDARRNLPKGIFIGILLIIALYLSVSYTYYRVIGFEELKQAKGIAAIVAERVFGPTGRYVFSLLLFMAVLAYVNVVLMSNPRVMYAMSEDGILPGVFRKKDEKRGVLTGSLTVFALLSVLILFFLDTFEKILSFTIFLDCIGMAFSAGTIFILRRRQREHADAGIYRMRFYPWMPLVFISAYVFVAVTIALEKPLLALTAGLVLALLMGLYGPLRRGLQGRQKDSPGAGQ